MNSDKHSGGNSPDDQRGNAMIYILIALALLGALTMVLGSQNDKASGENLNQEQAELMTTRVVAYSASAKQVVDQMIMGGTPPGSLNFVLPSEVAYDTPPHTNKVFHPEGGGLERVTAQSPPFDGVTDAVGNGWFFIYNNVQWTPTSTPDVIFTAYMLDKQICENINKKLTGSTTIPALTSASLTVQFVPGSYFSGSNVALDATICPACEGKPALCVSNTAGNSYGYYNIIYAR